MNTTKEWRVYAAGGSLLGYGYGWTEAEALEAWLDGAYAEFSQ